MEEQHSSKPPDDDLKSFEDYSCGLYKDRLLIPGRLYIAKGQVTFQPQFGQVTVIINISDITGLHKKNTAYVFPNAIEIATKPQKYFFGSFYFRDQAFATLQSLLPNQLKLEGEHESNDTEEEPGVNVLSFPNLLDQAKIYLNPSPSHPNPNPSSSSSSSSSNPPNSTLPNSNPSNPSSTELQSRENDTPTKRRSRAYSANSDDEELKPFASDMPLAAKGLAVFKRMTKSASERSVFDRSNTPPPPATSFSPPPPSSSYSLSANASPAVSPIPQPRYLTDQLDLDHHSDAEQQDNINNNDNNNNNNNNNNNTSVDNISEHTATEGNNENQSSEVSPSISPLHSPHIVTDGEGADISIGQDDHNNSNDSIKNTNNNNNNNNNNNSNNNSPVLPASSSLIPNSAAPPSPSLPKNKPPEPEKLKLPPIVEQCEHMNYSPEGFLLYIDENYPCPIQEFYRIVISNNFWNEVNDVLNYTDVTLTPWLTKTSPAGTPCCLVRQLNFKMELNGKIGPKSTRVQQAQRCRLKNSKELIIETSSVSMDVPYADNFTTDNLLIVKSTNDGASCNLRIACRVNFLKNIWGLGSIIEKNANQGSKDFFALWKELVRAKIEKEYTKQRILASPPPKAASNNQKQPAHRNHPASISPSPLSQSSNSQTQPPSLPSPSPQPSPQLQQPLPSLPPKHTPSKIASHVPQNTSAFTPVSNVAPKKFWPNLQHQMSQLPMPVVALGFVVLLIIAVGLPYVFYLHSRVAFAEAQIVEFNHSAERVNNKIAFMQLYINYLKEHPDSAPPPTPSSPRDDLKSEIAGLAHLLDLASALELRMSAWKVRLDHADTSLRGTQGVVDELRQEMSLILNHADQKMTLGGKIVSDSGNSGWVYFIVSFVLSVLLVAAGMFYFRQSLPSGVGGLLDKMKVL